ncbi:MAG TPA: polymer-forming cytoskeletal protein [Candidatus Methylomirabilis sp.]|nr:polymer-forming cytoskeletal protein [Candidatus Methylomirabilis sp.]
MSETSADRTRSIIPAGMTLRGKIEGAEELTVAGTVDGEIHLRGTLRLLESGRLRGHVTVWEAVIAGRAEGTLMASDRAEVLSTAHVEGEIRARRLMIAEGALVNGRMVSGPSDAHVSKLELIEEAVRWEEARRLPLDEGGGAA